MLRVMIAKLHNEQYSQSYWFNSSERLSCVDLVMNRPGMGEL